MPEARPHMNRISHFVVLLIPAFMALPLHAALPPVVSLAYRPDGLRLAAAQGNDVALIDPMTGMVASRFGASGRVTALAWNRDGSRLAVASGLPSKAGEVRLFNRDSTTAALLIPAHADLIHDLAFSPDAKSLATCSYDRLVKLWDSTSVKEQRALKDQSD